MEKMKKEISIIQQSVDNDALLNKSLTEWYEEIKHELNCFRVKGEGRVCARQKDNLITKFYPLDDKRLNDILNINMSLLFDIKYGQRGVFGDKADKLRDKLSKLKQLVLRDINILPIKDEENLKLLPNGCVAFTNGVYDFKNNKWLFKYKIIEKDDATIIDFPQECNNYMIRWYVKIDFDENAVISKDINYFTFKEIFELGNPIQIVNTFKDIIKETSKQKKLEKNDLMAFQLLYNMAHDENHVFDEQKFIHLCEILGYILYQEVIQKFVILIGNGSNGKDSVFTQIFKENIGGTISTISLDDITGKNQFVTSSLVDSSHNFSMENEGKVVEDISRLKELVGGGSRSKITVERKGVNREQENINCKFIFSTNDRNDLKFKKAGNSLERRVNLYELFYTWDPNKDYLRLGDYYDTVLFDQEMYKSANNISLLIYFGICGMKIATSNFTKPFDFTENEWRKEFLEYDMVLKQKMNENFGYGHIIKTLSNLHEENIEGKSQFVVEDQIMIVNNYNQEKYNLLDLEVTKDGKSRKIASSFGDLLDKLKRTFGNKKSFLNLKTFLIHNNLCIYFSLPLIKIIFENKEAAKTFSAKFLQTFNILPSEIRRLKNNVGYAKIYFGQKQIFFDKDSLSDENKNKGLNLLSDDIFEGLDLSDISADSYEDNLQEAEDE